MHFQPANHVHTTGGQGGRTEGLGVRQYTECTAHEKTEGLGVRQMYYKMCTTQQSGILEYIF